MTVEDSLTDGSSLNANTNTGKITLESQTPSSPSPSFSTHSQTSSPLHQKLELSPPLPPAESHQSPSTQAEEDAGFHFLSYRGRKGIESPYKQMVNEQHSSDSFGSTQSHTTHDNDLEDNMNSTSDQNISFESELQKDPPSSFEDLHNPLQDTNANHDADVETRNNSLFPNQIQDTPSSQTQSSIDGSLFNESQEFEDLEHKFKVLEMTPISETSSPAPQERSKDALPTLQTAAPDFNSPEKLETRQSASRADTEKDTQNSTTPPRLRSARSLHTGLDSGEGNRTGDSGSFSSVTSSPSPIPDISNSSIPSQVDLKSRSPSISASSQNDEEIDPEQQLDDSEISDDEDDNNKLGDGYDYDEYTSEFEYYENQNNLNDQENSQIEGEFVNGKDANIESESNISASTQDIEEKEEAPPPADTLETNPEFPSSDQEPSHMDEVADSKGDISTSQEKSQTSTSILPNDILGEDFSANYNTPVKSSRASSWRSLSSRGSFLQSRTNQVQRTEIDEKHNSNPIRKNEFFDQDEASSEAFKENHFNSSVLKGDANDIQNSDRSLSNNATSLHPAGSAIPESQLLAEPAVDANNQSMENSIDGVNDIESMDDLSDMSSLLDDNIHDQTRHILHKASTFKFTAQSEFDSKSDKSEGGNKSMGLKEEKQTIDALQQENFQLKLRIVVMEDQSFKNSEAGVAELKKQLSICQAARIAMKHENEKLRKTLDSIKESHEDDLHKIQEEKGQELYELQEDLETYRTYYEEAQEEVQVLHDQLVQTEELVTSHEASIENYKKNISELIVKNETLENEFRSFEQSRGLTNLGSLMTNYQSQNDSLHRRMATPGASRNGLGVTDQFNTIKKALALSGGSILSTTTPSRANSRLSALADTSFDELGSAEENPVFSSMLAQIHAAALDVSQRYRDSMAENETLRARLNQFVTALNDQRRTNEELSAAGNEKIEQLMQTLATRDRELMNSQEYINEMNEEMERVKQEIEEIEQGNNSILELKSRFQEKEDAHADLENQYLELQDELQALTKDIDAIQTKFDAKDKELEELRLAYSNSKEDVKKRAAEVKRLHAAIKALKAKEHEQSMNSLTSDISSLSVGTDATHSLVSDIVEKVKSVNGFGQTTLESLIGNLESILKEYKHTQVISSQLFEATEQVEELVRLLEEKDHLATKLGEKIESLKSDISARDQEILRLRQHSQQNTRFSEERLINEINDLKAQLEEQQNEEQILREELDSLHSDLEKALRENKNFEDGGVVPNEEYEQLHEDFERMVDRVQELEHLEQQSKDGVSKISREKEQLEIQLETLRNTNNECHKQNAKYEAQLSDLQDKYEALYSEMQSKVQSLGNITREKTLLSREYDQLTQNYEEQSNKILSLESQLSNVLQVGTNTQGSGGSSNGGSVGSKFKEQAYRRMIELEVEVKSSREKVKSLEEDLKHNKEKYDKRSREFLIALREIISLMSHISGDEWDARMTEVIHQTQNAATGYSTYSAENFSKIGALINEGIKKLDTKKRKYKSMAEALKNKEQRLNSETQKLESELKNLERLNEEKDNELEQQELKHRQQLESLEVELVNARPDQIESSHNRNIDNAALVKKISQEYHTLDKHAIEAVGGEIAMKVWEYRYRNMKDKFEKEREARKLEHENYIQSITQYEEKLAKDGLFNSLESPAQKPPAPTLQQLSSSSISSGANSKGSLSRRQSRKSGGNGSTFDQPIPPPISSSSPTDSPLATPARARNSLPGFSSSKMPAATSSSSSPSGLSVGSAAAAMAAKASKATKSASVPSAHGMKIQGSIGGNMTFGSQKPISTSTPARKATKSWPLSSTP